MDILKEYAYICFDLRLTEYNKTKEICNRLKSNLNELKRLSSRSFIDTTRSKGTATYEDYMAKIADLSVRLKEWETASESAKQACEGFIAMIDYNIPYRPVASEVREYARLKYIEGYTWKDLLKKYGRRENDNLSYALCVYKIELQEKIGIDSIEPYLNRVPLEVSEAYHRYKEESGKRQ